MITEARNSPLATKGHLFWEIDRNMIESALINNDDWVITRVFEYGEFDDIWAVIDLYGVEKTKQVLITEKLKPTATVMAYLFLGIDPFNKFKIHAVS